MRRKRLESRGVPCRSDRARRATTRENSRAASAAGAGSDATSPVARSARRRTADRDSIGRPGPGRDAGGRGAVQDADVQVRLDPDLTREADVGPEARLARQPLALELAHRARLAG